jgi:GNAT superfamily N-acetyltransferase
MVSHSRDAGAVLAEAGGFLASRPVEHNVIVTLLGLRATSGGEGRYWIVRHDGDCVGVVFQSPLTFPAALTPMPAEAARAAVEAMASDGVSLSGVNGEVATAAVFAGHWAEVCAVGARPLIGMRLQQLGQLHQPSGVPGLDRTAGVDDLDLLCQWMDAFADFTNEPPASEADVRRRIETDQLTVREVDGLAVCMVGHTAPVNGMVRIGPVFTPPEQRRHGYAGACVGTVSAQARSEGHGCILYTDLGNPTSNSVYRALGYRTISETIRYAFDESSTNALP